MEKTIEKNEEMFCYQCQETAKNIACTKKGVCGKTSDVANIEDLLVWVTKGLGEILTRMRKENKDISDLHSYVNNNLFTTITNANFHYEDLLEKVKETVAEALGADIDTITAETSFKEDLGADSLDLFEMVMSLEDTCGVEIPTEDLETMVTVGDVAEYLEQHKN